MGQDNIENMKRKLGQRIRDERSHKGWTIEKLSELLDVSPSFMGSVERGDRALSIEKLYKVSEVLEVTTDSLIKETLPLHSRLEIISMLVKDLDEKEFESVCHIIKTIKDTFKGKI